MYLIPIALFFGCVSYANADTWTTLDMPGAVATNAFGIDCSNIVGSYYNYDVGWRGFLYTIPEPSTLLLLGFGGLALLRKRSR